MYGLALMLSVATKILIRFLQSPYQVDMKNDVKCWKQLFVVFHHSRNIPCMAMNWCCRMHCSHPVEPRVQVATFKAIYPKYYKHLEEAVQHSRLDEQQMGSFLADEFVHQVKPKRLNNKVI